MNVFQEPPKIDFINGNSKDLLKYKIIFTLLDVKFYFTQTLLIDFFKY